MENHETRLPLRVPHQRAAARAMIRMASALVLVVVGIGCDAAASAVDRSNEARSVGVAGNCPADAGPMRPVGDGAALDHNKDGYGCVRRAIATGRDSLPSEVDNDARSTRDAAQRDPVWDALYTGM
ncbi:MAG TPA: hypothetical protein VFZ21_17285 [Gemmatimonadaceae bacterium]|nr:hypothetical protein [Gemmatimonadaceae bacterium]